MKGRPKLDNSCFMLFTRIFDSGKHFCSFRILIFDPLPSLIDNEIIIKKKENPCAKLQCLKYSNSFDFISLLTLDIALLEPLSYKEIP